MQDVLPVWAHDDWLWQAVLALLVLIVLLVGLRIGLTLARWREGRRATRARRLGQRGARQAIRLLENAGFEVLDLEVEGRSRVHIDGEATDFRVRADALVQRRRRRFVAEFKGGRQAARIANRHTRRQLLEYAHAFECDGLLLIDSSQGHIYEIEFPGL